MSATRAGTVEPRFFFSNTAYPTELAVLRFFGSEAISELFQYQIDLVAKTPSIDFDKMIGEAAKLRLIGAEADRFVHGIVTRFELVASGPENTIYRATLAPPHVKLTYIHRMRIFQEITTKDLVTRILKDCGIEKQTWNFEWTAPARDYCVQYRETDFDFISRLLAEDGVSSHFEHTDAAATIIFNNKNSGFKDIEGDPKVIYKPDVGSERSAEMVHRVAFASQMHIQRVELRDYNFSKPSVTTQGKAPKSSKEEYQQYDYPGYFYENGMHEDKLPDHNSKLQGLADDRALLRQELFASEQKAGSCASDSTRMIPGYTFTLGGDEDHDRHPRKDINIKYLVTRVDHEGTQTMVLGSDGAQEEALYGNTLRITPADLQYRPQSTAPKPRVYGVNTAKVVGPKNEEIYVDRYGRVKVQFHWDRAEKTESGSDEGSEKGEDMKMDEKRSCWIRVSQGWAGADWGSFFLPRVGHEVIVSFVDGDADRPLITGRLYNNLPEQGGVPYDPAQHKTRSTIKSNSTPGGGGSNEIRFEDKKGSEEIFTHAQKDQNEVIENNMTTSVGANQTLSVGADRTKTVDKNETTTVEVDRTETVNGKETITIKGDRKRTVTEGDEELNIDTGDRKITVATGDNTLLISTGDYVLGVTSGNLGIAVDAGDTTIATKIGDTTIDTKAGDFTADAAAGNATVSAMQTATLSGTDKAVVSGTNEVNVSGMKINITADMELTMTVGPNSIKLDMMGITINGVKVTVQGSAMTEIKGTMLKLN